MSQMKPEEKKAFRQLLAGLGNLVGADGKVDLRETEAILGLVKPLAAIDSDCAELAKVLEEARADHVITPEESRKIRTLVDGLSKKDTGLIYGIEDRPPFLAALFAAGAKLNCTDLLLITDHENGEEKRGDLMVRIVDIVTWMLESPKEKRPAPLGLKGRNGK